MPNFFPAPSHDKGRQRKLDYVFEVPTVLRYNLTVALSLGLPNRSTKNSALVPFRCH
jgi:hypothetical protein